MIKNRNVAIDAAIEQSKVRGLTAQGDTFYVVKRSSSLFEYLAARLDNAQLFVDVDSAINACTANHGDVIYVMPGHTESLATASAITADVAGISIIGIGSGAEKPTFTFSSTDNSATWVISAASVVLKNIIGTTSDDGLTKAFVVTGDDCELDLEWRDTSASVEVATAVRLDTANNCKLNLVFKGFTTGNAVTSAVLLDDCDNVDITIDAYGVVSTAWVNFVDVSSTNVKVSGTLYTQGITNFTRDVVDTIGSSTWSAQIYDASAGISVEGGSAAALASADPAAIAASITTLQTSVDTLDNIIDTEFPVVATAVGAVADATIADTVEGAAATTQSLVSDIKAVLQRIGADNANNTAATTIVTANADGSVFERLEYVQTDMLALPRCVEKSDGAVLTGNDNLFTISGGPIKILEILGIVTDTIGGASNGDIQLVTTAPAATVNLNAAPVAIDSDAIGTSYQSINTTGVFTPVTAGFVLEANSFATSPTTYIAPIGTIHFRSSAAQTGTIKWYLRYIPLSPLSRVVAAA